LLIRAIVTAAYTGWAGYSSLFVFQPLPSQSSGVIRLVALSILVLFWSLFAAQRSPWTFYLYIAFPCYFWQQFMSHALPSIRSWLRSQPSSPSNHFKTIPQGTAVVVVLQGMVVSYLSRFYL
jgi:phosphatidylinositol glycan class N